MLRYAMLSYAMLCYAIEKWKPTKPYKYELKVEMSVVLIRLQSKLSKAQAF